MSNKVTVDASGTTATVTTASLTDTISTLLDPNSAVTGLYKYLQIGLVGLAGAVIENKIHTGNFMQFGQVG